MKIGLAISYLISATGLFLLTSINDHAFYASHLLPGMLAFSRSGRHSASSAYGTPHCSSSVSTMRDSAAPSNRPPGNSAPASASAHRHSRAAAHRQPPRPRVAHTVAATDGYIWALRIGAIVLLAGTALVFTLFERVPFIPRISSPSRPP